MLIFRPFTIALLAVKSPTISTFPNILNGNEFNVASSKNTRLLYNPVLGKIVEPENGKEYVSIDGKSIL